MIYSNCFIILLLTYKAFCQIIISPSAVLLLNQPTKINCTSTKYPPLWTFYGVNIAGSLSGPCILVSAGIGLITSVETPNEQTCNLVINSVGLLHAGNYTCADGNTFSSSFIAIVADRLKCETSSTVISISNPVSLKCSATMSSNGNPQTLFTWTPTSSTSATTSPPINNYSSNISSSSITTQLNPANPAPSIPSYTCLIELPNYSYSEECYTSTINVNYQVCCMEFSGFNSKDTIKSGSSLFCTVSSNPPANISLMSSNGIKLNGCSQPTINQLACPITQEDRYTCSAYTSGNLAGDITITNYQNLSLFNRGGKKCSQSFSVYALLIGVFCFILKSI